MDYERLFLDQLDVIDDAVRFVVRRYRLSEDEQQELLANIRLKILDNDYELLRRFQGRSALKTYLAVVVHRYFLSSRAEAWGKWRPCVEAKRHGPLAVKLDQLLTRDGLAVEEAVKMLQLNDGVSLSERELVALAGRFPVRSRRTLLPIDQLAEARSTQPTPDAALERTQLRSTAPQIEKALDAALGTLPVTDRLIVRLHFFERLKLSEVARILNREPKPFYRHVEQVIGRLRAEMVRHGVDATAVRSLLGDPEMEWTPLVSASSGSAR